MTIWTPSPKKKMVSKSLLAAQEMQRASPVRYDKENICGIERVQEDAFASLNEKKEGSIDTKAKYFVDNGGSVYVPRLQLKKVDHNIEINESKGNASSKPCFKRYKSSSTTDTSSNTLSRSSSNNTKQRWKVCILFLAN